MRLLLGISGSISAYKTPDLIRLFEKNNIQTTVVLTENASQFVSPLSLEVVSQNKVYLHNGLFDVEESSSHLSLAKTHNALVIAPASANVIAKLAHGIADDLLTTLALSFEGPKLVVPAMHHEMWLNPATQANVALLKRYGYAILGPDSGALACGDMGWGRLVSGEDLVTILQILSLPALDLRDLRFLISAGGTQEPLDPVRHIGNKASGKLGYALALVAGFYGGEVSLVTTSMPLEPTALINDIHLVTTSRDLSCALDARFETSTHVIMSAAVSDFRPTRVSDHKLSREGGLSLTLNVTEDIIGSLSQKKTSQKILGFCLSDSEDLIKTALEKLSRKNLDGIVANTPENIGQLERDFHLVRPSGQYETQSKATLAQSAYHILKFCISL